VTHSGRLVAVLAAAASAVAGCGGGSHELVGYRTAQVTEVGDVALPDLTRQGEQFAFVAEPGGLLLVYFGYTNCPDFCPTTMSDVELARQRLDEPERVDVAMVTVDPGRDLAVLADYVTSFVPEAHALGTADFDELDRAAARFGVSYQVSEGADGAVEVAHSTLLYAVDDAGELALTWPFGVSIDDLAADLELLLEDGSA
jgi:protein SCO1/2